KAEPRPRFHWRDHPAEDAPVVLQQPFDSRGRRNVEPRWCDETQASGLDNKLSIIGPLSQTSPSAVIPRGRSVACLETPAHGLLSERTPNYAVVGADAQPCRNPLVPHLAEHTSLRRVSGCATPPPA